MRRKREHESRGGPPRACVLVFWCKGGKREKEREEEERKVRAFLCSSSQFLLRRLFCSLFTLQPPEFRLPFPFSPPRGPLHKLRNGFYPPRHASRRSVLAAAALTRAMQGAPLRQGDGDRSGLLSSFFFGSALSCSCSSPALLLSRAIFPLGEPRSILCSSPFSLRATAPGALCSPFRASRRRARPRLVASTGEREPRRARRGATRTFKSR